MLFFLKNFTPEKDNLVIGLMSGTSCDGLDVALISVKQDQGLTDFKLLKAKSFPYSENLQRELKNLPQVRKNPAYNISQFNFYLAQTWAEMINDFLKENELTASEITLIASHGQTVWHQSEPLQFVDRPVRSTLQIGDPSVLAKLTGIPVIGDFRVGDMAFEGQGAPLIPYFDFVFFSRFKKKILAINIGGIANFTFIPDDGDLNKVTGFDTGPGNMLLDQAMIDLFGRPFDVNGETAFKGQLSDELLKYLLKIDSYINMPPPKSTGREFYGKDFYFKIKKFAKNKNISPADIIHTLSFYTVMAIQTNYSSFVAPKYGMPDMVVVSGGGAFNRFILEQLQIQFGDIPVYNSEEMGVNSEFKEAIGFAVLGWSTLLGKPSNVPGVTGAKKATILGKICLP